MCECYQSPTIKVYWFSFKFRKLFCVILSVCDRCVCVSEWMNDYKNGSNAVEKCEKC